MFSYVYDDIGNRLASLDLGDSRVYGTSHAGGGSAHENRPPFYALCYIMRVK